MNESHTALGKLGFISITIPVFNEEESLPRLRDRLVASLAKLPHAWEVILVNDGSTDNSAALLDEIAASEPAFRSFTSAATSARSPR